MSVDIKEEPIERIAQVSEIPIAFEVNRILDLSLSDEGLGGIILAEVPVDDPWVKDYDAFLEEGPTRWANQFDISSWGLLTAHDANRIIGAAVVAFDTPGVQMLEGRSDLAVLWDIRVAPDARTRGVGRQLFGAAEALARRRGRRWLKIETQNPNVPACRLYARVGCTLGTINRFAYPNLPDEVQLLWYKQL